MTSSKVLPGRRLESVLATNVVLRNTYILLGLTMLFSAAVAGVTMLVNAPIPNAFLVLIGYFGLFFLVNTLRNSGWGLLAVFALTGFLGYTIGPVINYYTHYFLNGQELVMMSLGATGLIFFALSAYALTTKKDFSYMSGFLMVGMLVAFLASIATLFLHVPALMLAVAAMFVLLSSGLILYQTSQIIYGGETNYIMATLTLYLSIYNLFLSLLRLLGTFSGNRE